MIAIGYVREVLRENARRLFQRDGMTQSEWAEKIGVAEGTVSRLLNAGRFGMDALGDVAKRLDVPLAEFFREEKRKGRKNA